MNKRLNILIAAMILSGAPIIAHAGIVVTDEDFEGGAMGWSNNATRDTEKDNEDFTEFLGVFFGPNEEDRTVSKTFALSGTQTGVKIRFHFYEIDSWDNETLRLFIDDNPVPVINDSFHENRYDNPDLAAALQDPPLRNLGFFSNFSDQTYRYALTVPTTATSLTLMFDFGLNSGPDESAGIDNVFIQEIPEPSSVVLLGLVVSWLGWRRHVGAG